MDSWYLALLGLAEHFRTSKPPDIRKCVQCLMAVFKSKPPAKVEARTHLQLGTILFNHTKNIDLAKSHLDQAWTLSQPLTSFDDVKFEAASLLAEVEETIHQESLENAGRRYTSSDEAKGILRKALELSQTTHVYWHCRLLFQLAQMHAKEKDYMSALGLLGVGIDYAQGSSAHFTRILFTLSKAMLLLTSGSMSEAADVLGQGGTFLESFAGSPHQKEYLKVFFLVLQVCHYLMVGQVKSVKPGLKQLQQSVQTITQPNWPNDEDLMSTTCPADNFMWLPKEHMCVLVYLVTISHSMQAGYMEKAQKYSEKALAQVEKMKNVDRRPLLVNFQRMILEHMVLCQLVMGHRGLALRELNNLCHLLYHPSEAVPSLAGGGGEVVPTPALIKYQLQLGRSNQPQMHSLLGLYAMSLDSLDVAEHHFHLAVQAGAQSKELLSFVQLNTAIIRLMKHREAPTPEDAEFVERYVNLEKMPQHCHGLRAAALYVRGLHAFLAGRYNEAKSYLRDTLKMANAEDLNRLTSISLVLLGHIFLALNNCRESMNMVTPAMQLASKIPDLTIQLWAASIQKRLFRSCNETGREQECLGLVQNFTNTLLSDQKESALLPEHGLLQWFGTDDASPPPFIPTTPVGGPVPSVPAQQDQQQPQAQQPQLQDAQQQPASQVPQQSQQLPQQNLGHHHHQYPQQQQQQQQQHQHQHQPQPPQQHHVQVQQMQQLPGMSGGEGSVPPGPSSNPNLSSEGSAPATPATPLSMVSGGIGGGQTPPVHQQQQHQHSTSPAHTAAAQVHMHQQQVQQHQQLQQQQQQQHQPQPQMQQQPHFPPQSLRQYRHQQTHGGPQPQQPQQPQQQQPHPYQQSPPQPSSHRMLPHHPQQQSQPQAQPQQLHGQTQQQLLQQHQRVPPHSQGMSPQQQIGQPSIPHSAHGIQQQSQQQHPLYQQQLMHQHMMPSPVVSQGMGSPQHHPQLMAAAVHGMSGLSAAASHVSPSGVGVGMGSGLGVLHPTAVLPTASLGAGASRQHSVLHQHQQQQHLQQQAHLQQQSQAMMPHHMHHHQQQPQHHLYQQQQPPQHPYSMVAAMAAGHGLAHQMSSHGGHGGHHLPHGQ